jgi:hypothetical protein
MSNLLNEDMLFKWKYITKLVQYSYTDIPNSWK